METSSSVEQQASVFDAKLEIWNGGIKEKWNEKKKQWQDKSHFLLEYEQMFAFGF